KPASVRVLASVQGKLDAWIDFDAKGDWNGSADRIFQSAPLNPGPNDLTFFVPSTAVLATTFARFRFSTDGGLEPVGWARNGEVEDYRAAITMGADLAVNANFSPNPLPPNTDGQCTLSVV